MEDDQNLAEEATYVVPKDDIVNLEHCRFEETLASLDTY